MSAGRAKKVTAVAKPPPPVKGVAVKAFPGNAKALFMRKPKSPAPDNVGRRVRPTAHLPKQAAAAKRVTAVVKRLSGKSL